jgi:pimeloyl-ACP methyl ester carboxylesterase
MTTFVLIPGAGGAAEYWSEVVPLLEAAGHEAIAVPLPGPDETAGLPQYADAVVAAVGSREDVVLVAQSLGGFTAPLVCDRVPARALVFVNAMIPKRGERAADWGDNVQSTPPRLAAAEAGGYSTDFDLDTYFLHDLAPRLADLVRNDPRGEADAAFESSCRFDSWPDVPIRVLVGADDRLFPAGFQRRVARERLGVDADVVPGGHLIALANPTGVADYLLACAQPDTPQERGNRATT